MVEDEYHFMLECEFYSDIRKVLLPRYYYIRPSMFKLIQLMTFDCKDILRLGLFVYKATLITNYTICYTINPHRCYVTYTSVSCGIFRDTCTQFIGLSLNTFRCLCQCFDLCEPVVFVNYSHNTILAVYVKTNAQ